MMTTTVRTREEKIPIVAAGLQPQKTIKSVCLEHGISPSTYRKWRKEILEAIPRFTPGTRIEKKVYDDKPPKFRAINYLHSSLAMLNPVGYRLCQRADGATTVLDLARGLVSAYNINLLTAAGDAARFFDKLHRHKLVYFAGEEPPMFLETTSAYQPQEVWLHLTNACNLRCITCFKDAGTCYRREMSLEMKLDVVDQIRDLGVTYIVVSGGEPFIRRDTIKVIEHIAGHGIRQLIITNGTFITEELACRLADLQVWRVQVSLDGSCPEVNDRIRGKGSFDKALRGAKLLLAQGLDVRLYPTVTRLNIDDLPNIKKLVQELRPGFEHFSFAKFCATGRGESHCQELNIPEEEFYDKITRLPLGNGCSRRNMPEIDGSDEVDEDLTSFLPTRIAYGARKINCGLGCATFSIDADGNVYPCQWLHAPQWLAGNLYEQSLAEIYHGSEMFRSCRNIRVDHDIEKCRTCELKYFCGGGCRARSMGNGDALHQACDPACAWMYPFYKKAFWTDFEWGL